MAMHSRFLILATAAATFGCGVFSSGDDAILSGLVRRGPVTPVCQVDVPCEAPFSATFEVRRNNRLVATFSTANDGSFNVHVPAGELRIIPTDNAPIIDPTSQVKVVTLAAGDSVYVDLLFDTGIR